MSGAGMNDIRRSLTSHRIDYTNCYLGNITVQGDMSEGHSCVLATDYE